MLKQDVYMWPGSAERSPGRMIGGAVAGGENSATPRWRGDRNYAGGDYSGGAAGVATTAATGVAETGAGNRAPRLPRW